MQNTNFQTILQMHGIVNDIVKQATGRNSVSQIDMDFVTVAQDKQTVPHETDFTALANFVNNNQLPLTVLAKIAAVQSGTGDPSPDNIRPITGWTGAMVTRTGKNLFGGSLMMDGIKNAVPAATISETNRTIQYIAPAQSSMTFDAFCGLRGKYKENTPYTFIITFYKSSGLVSNMRVYYTDGTYDYIGSVSEIQKKETLVFVSNPNKTVYSFSKANQGGITVIYVDESGVFEGVLTAEDFESYTGQTYSITFPAEAGTVYGGTLNLNTGVLTVTMGEIESYNGETLPGAWISDRDVYAAGTTPTEGAEVVYVLAEPVTYELDPVEVKSMIGQNNVFADTGDVAVSYTSYIPVI